MISLSLRGGSHFDIDSWNLRYTLRSRIQPVNQSRNGGFRLIIRGAP